MAWQKRVNYSYYYRSTKDQGCVTTHYLGRESELRAHQAALEDQARHTARIQERQEQQAWEALDAQLTTTHMQITSLTHALLADGELYRRNRGEWRKRRTSNSRSWFVNLLYDHSSGQWEGHAILSAVFGSNFCHCTSQVVLGKASPSRHGGVACPLWESIWGVGSQSSQNARDLRKNPTP
jgi:hypothetical protein